MAHIIIGQMMETTNNARTGMFTTNVFNSSKVTDFEKNKIKLKKIKVNAKRTEKVLTGLFVSFTGYIFLLAIFIEIIILIKQIIYKKKIRVTSNFLLNNKIYNIMYVCYIICVITIAIILKVQPEFVIYQGANIFLIPFYYMYQ